MGITNWSPSHPGGSFRKLSNQDNSASWEGEGEGEMEQNYDREGNGEGVRRLDSGCRNILQAQ